MWLLVSRPGFLAAAYVDGRRKRYMAPISLFLLINLIFFFSVSLTDLNLSLKEQMNQPQHGKLAMRMVQSRLAKRHITLDEYMVDYNKESGSLSKTLIVLHAPMLALFLMPLYLRGKRYYFADHMIFALYLMAFVMLFSVVQSSILIGLIRYSVIEPASYFSISGFSMFAALILYVGFAVRRFYRQSVLLSVAKLPVVIVMFVAAHFVYRTLLFLTVFWTT